jgi:hypothetical protein
LPIVRIDGRDYFILSGTYQRLYNEKIISERYASDGDFDRQVLNTEKTRWKFTILTPFHTSYMSYSVEWEDGFTDFSFGDLGTLHASADKVYPQDGLYFFDIDRFENFYGTYSHYVYLKLDWEAPQNNDPGVWQVPVELWGRDA